MGKELKELWILHILNDGVRSTFVVMLPFIARDLSINLSNVGFLGSSQPLFGAILALPAGFLASKLGGFRILTFLLLIYSLGALSTSFSPNLLFIYLSFFLGAAGFGMFHTVGFSLVAKSSEKGNVGKNMGNFTAVGDLGRVAIPTIAVFLVSLIGWRLTFALLSLVGLTAFLVFSLLKIKKDEYKLNEAENLKESPRQFFTHILRLLQERKVLFTLLAAILDTLASTPVFLFLPFLILSKGITITQYGIITGVFFAGSLFGKFMLGRGVDKLGNIKIFIISEIMMAIGLLLLTFFSNFFIVLMLSFLIGSFTRGTIAVVQSMISQVSHKLHYDKLYGVSETLIHLFSFIIIILMGVLADKFGVTFVFYACSALAILAIFPALFLRKTG